MLVDGVAGSAVLGRHGLVDPRSPQTAGGRGRPGGGGGPVTHEGEPTTRERIITEAMRLFAERGYRGTTVGDIEQAAGLSPRAGGLYKHFASKDEVVTCRHRASRRRDRGDALGDGHDAARRRARRADPDRALGPARAAQRAEPDEDRLPRRRPVPRAGRALQRTDRQPWLPRGRGGHRPHIREVGRGRPGSDRCRRDRARVARALPRRGGDVRPAAGRRRRGGVRRDLGGGLDARRGERSGSPLARRPGSA